LDQILKESRGTSNMCMLGAIHAMLMANSIGHILSDNSLFNFGMVEATTSCPLKIVIIDAGSRAKTVPIIRSNFNSLVMKPFLLKASTLVQPAEMKVHREQWKTAGSDMQKVSQTYQERWKYLCNSEQTRSQAWHFEVSNSNVSACPHVASVLETLDQETLEWFTEKYLWKDVPQYGPSSDGFTRKHQDTEWTAAEKLEQLISETLAIRTSHCDLSANDILEEDKLGKCLQRWKNDYKQWMRPERLDKCLQMTQQQWNQCLRKAFRSHLFQIVGSYEMIVFFIFAPFSNDHLMVFRNFSQEVASEEMPDTERNGRILERSKKYLREVCAVR
jgi:hypothetical protein